MNKKTVKAMITWSFGIRIVMILIPIWIPFAVVYWILEKPLKAMRDANFSRLEWLCIFVMGLVTYLVMRIFGE